MEPLRYEYQQQELTQYLTEILGPSWTLKWSVGSVVVSSPVWASVPRPEINATPAQLVAWCERLAGDLHEGLVVTAARIRL